MAEKSFPFVEEKSHGVDWRRRLRQKSGYEAEQMAHLCKSEQMSDVEFVFDRGGEITVCSFICYFCNFIGILESTGSLTYTFYGLKSVSERAHL